MNKCIWQRCVCACKSLWRKYILNNKQLKINKVIHTGLGLTTQGEAQGFFETNGAYTYVDAQQFWYIKKGDGAYTHKEAQSFGKEIETSRHL